MRMRAKLALTILPAIGTLLMIPSVAFAHEQRDVGPIHMEVGFGTEPTYVGQPNSVQLLLTTHAGKPIVNLGDAVKVEVSFGGQSQRIPLVPNFEVGGDGIPGDYRAWFVPTQPGAYTFHFTGSVAGTKIDESFTGGPKTFSEAEDMSSIAFPQVQFPANNELAARIEADASRTRSALDTVTKDVRAASTSASDASGSASLARTIVVIALVVGTLGLVVGGLAFFSARKRA